MQKQKLRNNANLTTTSSLLSIHNDEELSDFLLLTSPPKKKTKISNNNETTIINDELNLYLVKHIFINNNDNTVELKLLSIDSNFEVACYLYDSW